MSRNRSGRFDDGIMFFAEYIGAVSVYFPEGIATCRYCKPFLRSETRPDRYSCRLTLEYNWILDLDARPEWCPLTKKEMEA